jgi:hypothetical protein
MRDEQSKRRSGAKPPAELSSLLRFPAIRIRSGFSFLAADEQLIIKHLDRECSQARRHSVISKSFVRVGGAKTRIRTSIYYPHVAAKRSHQ